MKEQEDEAAEKEAAERGLVPPLFSQAKALLKEEQAEEKAKKEAEKKEIRHWPPPPHRPKGPMACLPYSPRLSVLKRPPKADPAMFR